MLAAGVAGSAVAQAPPGAPPLAVGRPARPGAPPDSSPRGPLLPVALSAAVPGLGQVAAGQPRGAWYAAVEAFLAASYVDARARGSGARRDYIDLAFSVARAAFSPTTRDTAFGYFEKLDQFAASGPFDSDPAPGLQPPEDESTFNGSIWALARRTFLPGDGPADPDSESYQRALAFYRSRAVGENFAWSWRGQEAARASYRERLSRSNRAFARSTTLIGVLVANHLLSAVDAFVSGSLSTNGLHVTSITRLLPSAGGGLRLGFGLSVR